MANFLKKLVMVVKVVKVVLRIASKIVDIVDAYTTKLGENHAV